MNTWVKQGILLGFRFGDIVDASMDHGRLPFYDKDTLPLKRPGLAAGVRIVPGGSAIRDGAYLAPGVICMPPMYVNIGAWIGEQSLIDSHALVGSCAQVGARVHVSAGAQIGGVIEPVGALPVIIEDDALIGGNTGIYEGAVIKARAVVGAGTVLTGSTPVYDLVRGEIIRPTRRSAARHSRRRRRRAWRPRRHGGQGPGVGPRRSRRRSSSSTAIRGPTRARSSRRGSGSDLDRSRARRSSTSIRRRDAKDEAGRWLSRTTCARRRVHRHRAAG